jgi:hypothetical protein
VTRTTATVGAVTAVCGVVTLVAAVATVADWSTGPWTDTMLLIGAVIFTVAVGWIAIEIAISALHLTAAHLFAPAQPPSLDRINAIIEQRQAEQQAAVAARQAREPPPAEIVVALRAITGRRRH